MHDPHPSLSCTCPLPSRLQDPQAQPAQDPEAAAVALWQGRPQAYGTELAVCDSDHKPVFCELGLALPAYVQEQRRRTSMQVRCAVVYGGQAWVE